MHDAHYAPPIPVGGVIQQDYAESNRIATYLESFRNGNMFDFLERHRVSS